MPMELLSVLVGVLEFVLVAAATYCATRWYLEGRANSRVRQAQVDADRVLEEAETRRRDAALEAKDEAIRLRADLDRELTQRRKEIDRIERRIEQKEEAIDQKSASLDACDLAVRRKEQESAKARDAWEQDRARQQAALDADRDRHLA